MQKFGWSRIAILQQAEEVFISVSGTPFYLLDCQYKSADVCHLILFLLFHVVNLVYFLLKSIFYHTGVIIIIISQHKVMGDIVFRFTARGATAADEKLNITL